MFISSTLRLSTKNNVVHFDAVNIWGESLYAKSSQSLRTESSQTKESNNTRKPVNSRRPLQLYFFAMKILSNKHGWIIV